MIADKSSYTRLVLEDILNSEKDITIVGVVPDSDKLLEQLKETKPDVIVADLGLLKHDNLFTLKRIFSELATPIVLLLHQEEHTLDLIKETTEIGVYAVVFKPEGQKNFPNYRVLKDELLFKVRAVLQSELRDAKRLVNQVPEVSIQQQKHAVSKQNVTADTIIVIGASTGGTLAVESIIKQLAPDINASVLVAVHMPAGFSTTFTKRLKEITPLNVVEGKTGLMLKPGKVIVAPGGRNMVANSIMGNAANLRIGFTEDNNTSDEYPSIDLLMKSVAVSGVKNVVGVILTGMGKDGTVGASYIKERGGVLIAQDEESSAIFGMAKSAIDSGYINKVLPLSQISYFLNKYVLRQHKVSSTDSNA
nr:chemotaxis protein CheB [Pontibacter vulgaris]